MDLQVYRAQIDPAMTSDLEVNFIGLVGRPAIDRNFQAFEEQKGKAKFTLNEERQIISGPAMIADMPIYRAKAADMPEHYVIFDKPSIQTIVEKFSAKGYMKNFNLFHDDSQQVSDVTIFNSFLTDSTLGIRPQAGFDDVAEGSWFLSAHLGDATWARVKSGEIKGFSVEGLFSYIPVKLAKMTREEAVLRIQQILNETTIED